MTRISRSDQELIAVCVQERTLAGIGRALGVSPKAARRRRDALYAQLGVATREQLFNFALQEGMIALRVTELLPYEFKE